MKLGQKSLSMNEERRKRIALSHTFELALVVWHIIVKQNCFWEIVVRRMQQVAWHMALNAINTALLRGYG